MKNRAEQLPGNQAACYTRKNAFEFKLTHTLNDFAAHQLR
jgi:hypothetical protein